MTDEPTPEELEQLARSVAMLGDRDRLDVVAALRRLADIEQSKRLHPSAGWEVGSS